MFIALTPCADLGEGVWSLDTPSPEKLKFLKLTYKITEKIHRFLSSQQSQIFLGTQPPPEKILDPRMNPNEGK